MKTPKQVIQYLLVGGTTSLVFLGIYHLLITLGVYYLLAAVVGFFGDEAINYLCYNFWVFKDKKSSNHFASISKYGSTILTHSLVYYPSLFLLTTILNVGTWIIFLVPWNWAAFILNYIPIVAGWMKTPQYMIPAVIAELMGTVFKYLSCKYWIWGQKIVRED